MVRKKKREERRERGSLRCKKVRLDKRKGRKGGKEGEGKRK